MRPVNFYATLSVAVVLLLIVAVPLAFSAEHSDPKLNLDRVVEAIRLAENWDGRSVGASGEVGPWQFQKSVWIEFSTAPFPWAWRPEHRAEQRETALRFVTWIDNNLIHIPLPRTAKSIGLVWTNGYTATKRKKIGAAKRDYAQRVQNLYDDLTASERARTPFRNTQTQ